MNKMQVKSPCCSASVRRYGGRRRQCTHCLKTWRMRIKKRGRPTMRASIHMAQGLLETGATIKQRARSSGSTERSYQRRVQRSLAQMRTQDLYDQVPPNTDLTLLIDGIWTRSEKQRAVIYLAAVKPLNESVAYLLPPQVYLGTETAPKWRQVIQSLPDDTQNHVRALVCDGITGMTSYAHKRGWVVQRCQFHFIKSIERFKGGKNRFVPEKELRYESYLLMRQALVVPQKQESALFQKIKERATLERCPKWIRKHAEELMRARNEFRAHLNHPELQLPRTTGCMESTCAIVRTRLRQAHGFKTINSLCRWVTGLICIKKTVTCNSYQPNNGR